MGLVRAISQKSVAQGTRDIKCVVVGDGGVGKTSMLLSYTTGDFMMEYVPTVFDTFSVSMDVNGQECNVGLYDTAGQEAYDTLRTLVYYDTDIFVVCFSVARPDSFDNVRSKWIPELKVYRPKAKFILVGTQVDLREEHLSVYNAHEFVSKRHGTKLSLRIGAEGYYECSALTQVGLRNVFEKAVTSVLRPKRRIKLWRSFRSVVGMYK